MSNQNATLSACNGGATGFIKDIQRRLSSSGILPALKSDPPSVIVSQHVGSHCPNKPVKLKNVGTGAESYDTLHYNRVKDTQCSHGICFGSVVGQSGLYVETTRRSREEILTHAKQFIDQYYSSTLRLNSQTHRNRWEQVEKLIRETGTYQLTETELTFGAKLAWRNAPRCIGRIQWSKLQVFDCRQVTTTTGMFEAICNHIKYSTNKGNIRSAITIFPQRTDGKHDFRVWNQQLISYAGYKNPDGTITGDPLNVEFTEVCMKMGWKGKGGQFDLLPLVLQSNGHDPDYFDFPPDLVMEVNIEHPEYQWFGDLNLKWYVVPAVSSMLLDCGGLEFPAAPFNGWYMSSEIGCRDLCDETRYNILEKVATRMGLDTRSVTTLWKDRALIEVNIAVLHSFQKKNVTVVDHHTAAEWFMKHYENEQKVRNGCPSDWVWIVPPISGSVTPVFHQEFALYHLKPSYDYQEPAWRTHEWKKDREVGKTGNRKRRKFHFKQLARAVKFTSKLFGKALSKRIKATILYATETGKSETFAKRLFELFGHAFNAQVYSMDAYDVSNLEHEALLLVVASTAGNGDAPEGGAEFASYLRTVMGASRDNMSHSKGNISLNSDSHNESRQHLEKWDSVRGSLNEVMAEFGPFGPLSNVRVLSWLDNCSHVNRVRRFRFAVFALGSSAYPNFCAFGKHIDELLLHLGGERILKVATGDEMCAQEQAFSAWSQEVFKLACEAFCLDEDNSGIFTSVSLKPTTVRIVESTEDSLPYALASYHNRKVSVCQMIRKKNLHEDFKNGSTLGIALSAPEVQYQPGDHVGVFPCNRFEIVEGVLQHLGSAEPDKAVELQILKETSTPNAVTEVWEAHDRLPRCSLRTMFTRFLDITTPPSPNLLQYFASTAEDTFDKERLLALATDSGYYDDWCYNKHPHLLEVFQEFPSIKPNIALLVAQLSPLQPRFYSISSSPKAHPGEVHLTVAVVTYRTNHGKGPLHYGVCSNYLNDTSVNDNLYIFIRSAPQFHLPRDTERPLILVGPGTGIAPFRGFWHQRSEEMKEGEVNFGPTWLFFGCRNRYLDLYKDEKAEMIKKGVMEKTFLALSREPNISKTYVQDIIRSRKEDIYRKLVEENGHFYVCGDCTMADGVCQTLKQILHEVGRKSEEEVEGFMTSMKNEGRYHEDIFGITLRTAEVHRRSRESARMRMASQSS